MVGRYGSGKRKEVLLVMVVDRDAKIRQMLIDYFLKIIRPVLIYPYDKTIFRKMANVSQVKKAIKEGKIIPGMIVFSQNFPSTEYEKINSWLNSQEFSIPLISVPLPRQEE